MVWLGWTTMLLGMGVVVLGDISKNERLKAKTITSNEEE
jgi:hypothetical protein